MAVKILAADDSATMRKVLEMTFAGEAVEIETVDSGEAAVERASKNPPDLVIADLSMDKDGYEVARALKSSAATAQVAVMVMSSQHLEFDAQRAAGAGVDDFILKPYDSQAMIDKVKDVLAKPRAEATEGAPAGGAAKPAAKAAAKPTPSRPARPGVGRPRGSSAPSPRSTVAFGATGGRPVLELADEDPPAPKRPVATKPAAQSAKPMASKPMATKPLTAKKPAPKRPVPSAAKKPPALPGRPTAKSGSSPGRAAAATAAGGEMAGKLSDLGLTAEQIEGVLALSREVIEQVVWEVVPDLAELLIKEEIKRLTE